MGGVDGPSPNPKVRGPSNPVCGVSRVQDELGCRGVVSVPGVHTITCGFGYDGARTCVLNIDLFRGLETLGDRWNRSLRVVSEKGVSVSHGPRNHSLSW